MSWKDGSVGAVVGEQQVGIADDRGQDVVEVVGDAAGELADRLHLLALDEALLQRALFGGVEGEDGRVRAFVALGIGGRRDEEPRRARRLAREGEIDRGDVAFAGARRGERFSERGVVAFGDPRVERRSRFARRRLQRRRRESGEGAVGAQHAAVGRDRSDRHRRRVEEAGEAHFGGAQVFAGVLARGAVERQRARRAGQAGAGEGDAVQQPHRQKLTAAALEVDVEPLRRHFAGTAGDDAEQRRAVAGDDVGEFELSGGELGDIVVEPVGERRVHVDDRAVRIGGEEAGRRVVEIVDRVLQILEEALVALALAGDVADRPQRRAAPRDAVERADADAVPGRRAVAGKRRRHAQLFDRALAAARGLGQPVDRLGDFRRAGEQPLDQLEVGRAFGAGKDAVGVVGVDDARVGVGDDQPVAIAVGDRLGDVEAARPAGELQLAEGVEQDREDAEDRQQRDRQRDRLDPEFGRQQQERRHGAAKDDGERQQQRRVGGALDPVDRRRRIGVHGEPISPSPVRPGRSPGAAAAPAGGRDAAHGGRAGAPPSASRAGVSRTAPVFMTHMI